jgi:predicted metalloprotease with PDZ domain
MPTDRLVRTAAVALGISVIGTVISSAVVQAQTPPPALAPVRYEIRFPDLAHREAEVTVRFTAVAPGPLVVRMARSSPGRYALHEFAKNVYAVRATTPEGEPLPVSRRSPHEWSIAGHRGAVTFQYTLFADRADGTYAGIDETRAHLNIPATFAWAPTLATRPVEVTFRRPDPTWAIATQLEPSADPETFRAPNLAYFMDSPTHLGRLDVRSWTVASGGRTQTIRLAVNHEGTAEQVTAYTALAQRVVTEAAAIFGGLPRFDFGTYTFIACYRATCAGDGMEHRNSTSLTASASLAQAQLGLLGTLSHEFVHAWNVERLRPRSLEPFDFTEANMSGELWLAEGFTNYYGTLVLARAGIVTPREYARRLTGAVNALTTTPARRFGGAVAMSQEAPFVDAAAAIDPNNRANTFLSYYTYGEALGLALDLTLRGRPSPRTLDDLMRIFWARHGEGQTPDLAPARPYTLADFEAALATVTMDSSAARRFVEQYVIGGALPDYPALLDRAGFLVRPAFAGRAWMGEGRLAATDAGGVTVGAALIGTPLYEAGIATGDRILRIGDQAISTPADVTTALASRAPGDRVTVTWTGRGGERRASVTLVAHPAVEVVAYEDAGRTPSAAQLAFRASWLDAAAR